MAGPAAQNAATLSILDRLTDEDPESSRDRRSSPWEDQRNYKISLCRDLADLLNTRRAEQDFDPGFDQVTNSILTFGVTDFTAHDLKSVVDQDQVRRSIERSIRLFEPRLSRVSVSIEPVNPLRPALRFRVDALLRTGTDLESILFDVTIHRDSRRVAVTGANS